MTIRELQKALKSLMDNNPDVTKDTEIKIVVNGSTENAVELYYAIPYQFTDGTVAITLS